MTAFTTSLRQAARDGAVRWWPWFVPALVAGFIYYTRGRSLDVAVAGLLALIVVAFAAQRPDIALLALIIGLPFQGLLLAQLYAWGVPAEIVRPLASWKEALGLGVVVAGVIGYRRSSRHLDALDKAALAFVALAGVFAVFPRVFATIAPTAVDTRSLAFRSTVGFVLILLGARHARLPAHFVSRAARVAMTVGAVVAAITIYEFFFSDSWNTFVVDKVQYTRYQLNILKVFPTNSADIRWYGTIGGVEYVRVGSVFLTPLALGFYLLLPFAVALERTVRTGLRSGAGAVLTLVGTALLFTQTRAALLGAVIVAFIAFRPAAGHASTRRWQLAFVLAIGIIIALPAAAATEIADRSTSATSGDDQSALDHVDAFWNGVEAIGEQPLGYGLGTSAGAGQRFEAHRTTITENNYLQVGIELGVVAMALFIAVTILLLRRLNRAAESVDDLGIAAVRCAGFGLAIGAFFLHTWNDFATSWTFWGLAGAALGTAELYGRRGESEPDQPSLAQESGPGHLP